MVPTPFFFNPFRKVCDPAEGFGYVSIVIYVTAWVAGCCLQLVHAQGEPAKACSKAGPEFILRNRVRSPGRT